MGQIYQSINQSTHQPIIQSTNHSINQSKNTMVRHIVMWTIRETGSPRGKLEAMAELKSKLLDMKEQIREIRALDVHFNSITAPQDNFEVILECEFSTWADLEVYRKHPVHVEVAEYARNIRQSRAAIDYEY